MKADQASATARLIARSMVFMSLDPRIAPLIPARTVEISRWFMDADPTRARRLEQWSGRPWFRGVVNTLERAVLPGMTLHYLARKRGIEAFAREALAAGTEQVVVLGAGLDVVLPRLAEEHPDRLFVELDHPATQAVKREGLAAHGALPANLALVPLDLVERTVAEALADEPRFSPQRDTLFIAEGVLMYLPPERVREILRFCRENGGAQPRLAFTFMERLADGRIAFRNQRRVIDWWLQHKNEPFTWGLPVGEMPAFLAEIGWRARSILTPDLLRAECLPAASLADEVLADGDHLCLAEGGQRRAPGDGPAGCG